MRDLELGAITLTHWVLYFDGSRTDKLSGAGIALENPTGVWFAYSFQLEWNGTNNQAEYEAVIIGLEILLEMGIHEVEILGDSLLVINQLKGTYKCLSFTLVPFSNRALELLDQFDEVSREHIPREEFNHAANELAQLATGIGFADGIHECILKVEHRTLPSFMARREYNDEWFVATLDAIDVDWRQPIIDYLDNPQAPIDRQTRLRALNYVLKGGELLRRGEDGVDFRCIFGLEAKRIMREVHLGICGSHQAGSKMRWLIRRHGFYWPTILKDCISFAKGCLDCQAHGPVHHIPAIPMQPIIKP